LPGSAEAQVISGGIVKHLLIAYFTHTLSVTFLPKISKFIHVCQSYSKPKVGRFFETWFSSLDDLPIQLAGLPLSTQKKSLTFPAKVADNTSNKCTFINTKSACYEVSVAFQKLTNVNSKR